MELCKKEKKPRSYMQGYFTVEAALVLPMVIAAIVLLIYLAFFQYNRCLMEQDAAMLLVKSGGICVEDDELLPYLEHFAQNVDISKYLAWEARQTRIEKKGRNIVIKGAGNLKFPFWRLQDWNVGQQWNAQVTYKHKRLEPVNFVRIYSKLKLGGIKDASN